ncbi:hypothetical protein TNCV_203491 [Trichonephila clavipes]|nr:hypothetical protein TNCV_203491 [Trichonephila clavipes]
MSDSEEVTAVDAILDPPSTAQQIEVRNATAKECPLMPFEIVTFLLYVLGCVALLLSYESDDLNLRYMAVAILVLSFIVLFVLCLIGEFRKLSRPLTELPHAQTSSNVSSQSSQLSSEERSPLLSRRDGTPYPGMHRTKVDNFYTPRRRRRTASA